MAYIVVSQVMQYLTKNNINHQNGFRSKLSIEAHLIKFAEDILRGMKAREHSDVVVVDLVTLSAKFDTPGYFTNYRFKI